MKRFIGKFEKEIQGVLSGFDRVLFRGSWRRLTHSLGMKWCSARATNSFPVPVGPVTSAVRKCGAMRRIVAKTSSIVGLRPMMSSN